MTTMRRYKKEKSRFVARNNWSVLSRIRLYIVCGICFFFFLSFFFFFQAEDGIRDLVRSRGLGDVYKRQVDTFCDLAGNAGLKGSAGFGTSLFDAVQLILVPWPMYLLIMTLGTLQGRVGERRKRWYTISFITASTVCLIFALGIFYYRLHFSKAGGGVNFTLNDPEIPLVIAVIFLGLLLGAVMIWFIIEVVRLGLKLLRTKGYARWIGAGALASSLLAFLLSFTDGLQEMDTGLHSFLQVVRAYCSHVAVPLSVAVYLAIRTAHHGRLVARQRDDLDLEVKERTAELSAEKDRSEELLLNILPAEVAEELKATGAAKARHFEQASVLFTDFQGFTSMSAEPVSYTHLRAHETVLDLVCRLLLEKKKKTTNQHL